MAEEKKAKETPTLEEEKPKEKVEVADPAKDTEALLAELEKAGVSNTEQLQGKLIASSQAGNLANQLGTAREEIAELKSIMENQTQQRVRPEESYESEESDLTKIMERSVETALNRREKKQREDYAQVQQASNAMWNKIYNHPKYELIKPVWEKKFENPNFSMQIQQGLLNPMEEFHNTLNEYWEGIAQRSVNTIKTLQGKGPKIPHIEGEGRIVQTPEELSQDEERIQELQKKAEKASLTEEEELEAVILKTKGLNWV